MPEGVYQFDADTQTVVDLNVAIGQNAPLEVEQPKLTILPTKKEKPDRKVKEGAKAKVKQEIKQKVKQRSGDLLGDLFFAVVVGY